MTCWPNLLTTRAPVRVVRRHRLIFFFCLKKRHRLIQREREQKSWVNRAARAYRWRPCPCVCWVSWWAPVQDLVQSLLDRGTRDSWYSCGKLSGCVIGIVVGAARTRAHAWVLQSTTKHSFWGTGFQDMHGSLCWPAAAVPESCLIRARHDLTCCWL